MHCSVLTVGIAAGAWSGGPVDASAGDVVAHIEVADRQNYRGESYRYIVWNGESYGPLECVRWHRAAHDHVDRSAQAHGGGPALHRGGGSGDARARGSSDAGWCD
jgi:hypothetical protein